MDLLSEESSLCRGSWVYASDIWWPSELRLKTVWVSHLTILCCFNLPHSEKALFSACWPVYISCCDTTERSSAQTKKSKQNKGFFLMLEYQFQFHLKAFTWSFLGNSSYFWQVPIPTAKTPKVTLKSRPGHLSFQLCFSFPVLRHILATMKLIQESYTWYHEETRSEKWMMEDKIRETTQDTVYLERLIRHLV